MNAVIGQEKLVKILDGYTLHTVPKTMLFLGPSGCGKSWIAARFAESLKLPVVNIDSTVTPEKLIEYYQSPIEKMYIIDLKGIDEKQQNKFLKFIEEPSATMYIILTAESEIGILPTILNRCMKYHFEEYTVDQLKQFDWAMNCSDDIAYQIVKTPGQLLELSDDNLDDTFKLCNAILTLLKTANYANALSIYTKINCKDDPKKIDFNLFLDLLTYSAFDKYKKENDEFSFKVYQYTIRQRAKILNKTISKESFLLNFFDNLWRLAH